MRRLVLILFLFQGIVPSLFAEEEDSLKEVKIHKINMKGIPLLTCVVSTLEQEPNILIQREETVFTEGVYQFQGGQFDWVLTPSLNYTQQNRPQTEAEKESTGTTKLTARTTDASIAVQKLLRNGVFLGPQATITQDNTDGDLLPASNRAKLDFVITVPLLRDLGREATGAQEMAAEKNYEASVAQLRFIASQSALNTIIAYWNYVAAEENVKILKASEERSRILVENTQKLVDKEEQPKANLDQVKANLADKTAQRVNAEQTLTQAQHELGLAMGIPFKEIDPLPLPSDFFPKISDRPYPEMTQKDSLIKAALQQRGDLDSLKLQEKGSKILLTSAKNGLLHKLDLNLSGGYSGLEEGTGASSFVDSLEENVSGFDAKAGFTYEWPFANDAARGIYLQSKATFEQNKIRTYDLARTISSRVSVAISALKRNSIELANSIKAYQYYATSVKNEKEKLYLGMSTIIDVINFEDKLLSTKLNHISAHQRYAIALAQLRFETGTLINDEEDKHSIDMASITTVPLLPAQ